MYIISMVISYKKKKIENCKKNGVTDIVGDQVKKGAPLATFENADATTALDDARSQYAASEVRPNMQRIFGQLNEVFGNMHVMLFLVFYFV